MAERSGSVAGLAGSIYATLVFRLVTGAVLAHAVGPAGRGEVAAAQVYAAAALLVVGLGFPAAVGHAAARDDTDQGALIGAAIRYALLAVPVAALLGALAAGVLMADLSTAARVGGFVLVAVAPLNVVTASQRWVLTAEGALRGLALLRVAPFAGLAVATVGLGLTGTLEVGPFLAASIVVELGVNALGWWLLPIRPHGPVRLGPLVHFGVRGGGSQLAGFGIARADQAVLAPVVSTGDLGLYAVAANVANIPSGIGQALAERTFGEVARGDPSRRAAVAARHIRLGVTATLVLSAAAAAASPLLVPVVYGEAFRGALSPLFVLLAGTPALAVANVARNQLVAVGRPGRASIADLVTVAWVVVGLALVVGDYGIMGAAWVSTTSYWARLTLMLWSLRRAGITDFRPRRSDLVELAARVRRRSRRRPDSTSVPPDREE